MDGSNTQKAEKGLDLSNNYLTHYTYLELLLVFSSGTSAAAPGQRTVGVGKRLPDPPHRMEAHRDEATPRGYDRR